MFLSAHKYTVVFMKIKLHSLKYNFISSNWTKVEHHLKQLVDSILLTTAISFSNLTTQKSMQRRKEKRNAALRFLKAKFATSFHAEVTFIFLKLCFCSKQESNINTSMASTLKRRKRKLSPHSNMIWAEETSLWVWYLTSDRI